MEFPALSMEGLKEGTVSIPGNLANPKKWLKSYSEFITKNAGAVSQIESGLRSLTYIIPGRSLSMRLRCRIRMRVCSGS